MVVTFSPDDEIVVSADSTLTLTVKADIAEISESTASGDSLTYKEGTRVKAIIGGDDDGLDFAAVYEDGDPVVAGDITAPEIMGRQYELHKVAPRVTLTGGMPSVTVNDNGADTTLSLQVRATGGNIYVKATAASCNGDDDALFKVELGKSESTADNTLNCNVVFEGSPTMDGGYVVINEGQTQDVTVNVHIAKTSTAGAAGFVGAEITEVRWRTSAGGTTQDITRSDLKSKRAFLALGS